MADKIVVKDGREGYYEEKKSKFISRVYSVHSEEEAYSYIEAAKKKYWDARHNCYAFVLGDNNEVTKCSDDGEPSQTAGKPILEVITGGQIHDCLIIVTRYFGGTLLGTGGLVRAYTKSAKDAVDNSVLGILVPAVRYHVKTDYNSVGKIQYASAELEAKMVDTIYAETVEFIMDIEKSKEQQLIDSITGKTNGRAVITKEKDVLIDKSI